MTAPFNRKQTVARLLLNQSNAQHERRAAWAYIIVAVLVVGIGVGLWLSGPPSHWYAIPIGVVLPFLAWFARGHFKAAHRHEHL